MEAVPPPFPSTVEILLGVLLLAIGGIYWKAERVDRKAPSVVWRFLQLLLLFATVLLLFSLRMRFYR